MREVAAPHSSSSAATVAPPNSIPSRVRPSTGAFAPPPAAGTGSGGWTLPPLNQFMTLPRRFMPSSFGGSVDSSASNSPSTTNNNNSSAVTMNRNRNTAALATLLNDEEEEWTTHNQNLALPHVVRFRDGYNRNDAATGPVHQPVEIDLTVSSSEDEDGAQNAAGDSDDVIEILDVSETSGVPQPAPLRRKRRRPGVVVNGNVEPVIKRQRGTDIMRSADSTNVSMQNSEVVEEFKRRLKCSICLDVLEDMTSTLCGHVFCAGCINQAIRANGKCPLCQRRLHLKDTHRLFF